MEHSKFYCIINKYKKINLLNQIIFLITGFREPNLSFDRQCKNLVCCILFLILYIIPFM